MKTVTEAEVRAAFARLEGNATWAASYLGISRAELWDFICRRPDLETFVDDFRATMTDDAESFLREAISEGKQWAVCFVLKTLGKHRGYGKHAVRFDDWAPSPRLETPADLTRLRDDEQVDYLHLKSLALGAVDGQMPAEPEHVVRLDRLGQAAPAGAAVVQALKEKLGNIGRTANQLGVTRTALVDYLDRRPQLYNARDAHEEMADHAESALRSAIYAKKSWAIIFTLTTLGNGRGFSEYPRDDPPPPPSEKIWPGLSAMNEEQLERLIHYEDVVKGC